MAVVDDDTSLCKALRRLLSAWEMRAVTYPSAEAFLEDFPPPPLDCLILDIQLGGMSGFDLEEELRETGCVVPVIFITAQDVAENPRASARDRSRLRSQGGTRRGVARCHSPGGGATAMNGETHDGMRGSAHSAETAREVCQKGMSSPTAHRVK